MSATDKATTAAEFKEKYGRRRLSASTAGKAVLYNYLYKGYQQDERAPEIKPLYPSIDTFYQKVQTLEDLDAYHMYVNLVAWLTTAFEAAVTMRNALTSVIAQYYNLTASALAGENIRRHIGEQAEDSATRLWLQTITIDHYTPQSDSGDVPETLRGNIDSALRYLLCYNTCIRMIADKIETPELDLYRVDMRSTEARLQGLNEALTALREDIAMYRGAEVLAPDATAEEVLSSLWQYTPDYLKETLKGFENVAYDPEPIPEENIKAAENILRYNILIEHKNAWYALLLALKRNYFRRRIR